MYDVDKISFYPEVLDSLKRTGQGRLLTVHLMPQNLCNQHCSFCSYRMPENKNSENFNENSYIPPQHLHALFDDFMELGVEGIEVTGGGEPLAYPYSDDLWGGLRRTGIATALVTNGTLLDRHYEKIRETNLKWLRVSIDAANSETYSIMRKTSKRQFFKAWEGVKRVADNPPISDEFRLGVGFTQSNENMFEVYDFVGQAKDAGADNVRLSLTFSDKHLDYFKDHKALTYALQDSLRAEHDFGGKDFKVINLMPQRYNETVNAFQNYPKCHTKDVLCVVEGEGKVYTCCTFTGSKSGYYGNFIDYPGGFKALWGDKAQWRSSFDPRKSCQVACLYEQRNLKMLELVENQEPKIHKEFI